MKVSLSVDRDEALQCIRRGVVKPGSPAMEFIKSVCDDSYDRLLEPSMERELRTALTDMANEQAIHNFALNLRPLLMQPPVKGAITMGLDPGYSHGCKVRPSWTRRARCSNTTGRLSDVRRKTEAGRDREAFSAHQEG